MSAQNRSEDGIDEPLSYAPRWLRRSKSIALEQPTSRHAPSTAAVIAGEATPRITNAPPMAPGIGGYNIDLPPPKSRPFQGDVAIKDMRRQLSLDPKGVPEPPIQKERKRVVRWHRWLSFLAMVVVIIGLGILVMMFHDGAWKPASKIADVLTPLREGLPGVGTLARPTRLVVESQKGFANDPLPLGISLNNASGGETVILAGFVAGTELSAGTPLGPTRWRVSAHELGKAIAYSPKDFFGVMDVAIDLRSADDQPLDSQVVRLEWIKREQHSTPQLDAFKSPTVIQLDPEEIAMLERFLKDGDILSARLLLKRAASTGNAQAALELGMTFDPVFLTERGVVGFAPDIAQAGVWYKKAAELGSTEASHLLERLANIGR